MSRVFPSAVLGAFTTFATFGAAVHVWQDSIELPTYTEHDPDPAPEFAAFKADMPNYPYPVRSQISASASDRSLVRWRTLNLENEYLFCRILPDLGGHLYNCRDKLSQREVFYANPVIKKDLIGLRGAWIATGIEPNFPATHNRLSASPVNFLTRSYADGSAGVIVGDTDRVTGMRWRVEYRLRPETAALEQRISLYNPTPARQPYLWWNNAEIELDDPGTRYIIPTNLMISHDRKTLETWPVNSAGVDMSVVANAKKQATWFAVQSREPFMAIYKPQSRTGVAHYADPKVVAGKKVWVMGDDLEFYRARLTDHANMYAEMQAGLFADQQTYEFVQPEQSRTFREYWIPFRDVDGLTRATPDAALYAQRSGMGEVKIEIQATHPIRGARIRLIGGTRVIFDAMADLDPRAARTQVVKIAPGESYTVQVLDRQGHILIEHAEQPYAAAGPNGFKTGTQSLPDWNARPTEWLLLRRGEYNESVSQDAFARSDYIAGLQTFRDDPLLAKAAGRLDVSLLRFEEAAKLLETLAAQKQPDPEVLYYAGIAQSMAGREDAARALLAKAEASRRFAAPASLELSLIAARAHNFAGALKLPEPGANDPIRAARIGGIRVALLRQSGDRAGAARELEKWRAVAPEDPFLRYEATLSGSGDPALWSYLAGDGERVLDIAYEYLRLGLAEGALALLRHDFSKDNPMFVEPGAVPPQQSALVAYYRGYCEAALKMDAASDLRRASELGTRYMFPYRATSYAVLRWAIEKNPSDATAHALMGNLNMYSFRIEDAMAEWQKAVALNPKLEIERKSIAEATALLRRKPDTVMTREPAPVAPPVPSNPVPVARTAPYPALGKSAVELAESAMLNSVGESPDAAAAIFRGAQFAQVKQPDAVRQAYIEVQLQRLLAASLNGKCDGLDDRIDDLSVHEDTQVPFTFYGFSEFIKTAHFQYYLGVAEANCGRSKQAAKYWSKVSKMKEPASSPDFAYPLLAESKVNPEEAKSSIAEAMKKIKSEAGLDAALSEFSQGLLLRASGQERPAAGEFGKALQSGNVLVKYLAALELARKQR